MKYLSMLLIVIAMFIGCKKDEKVIGFKNLKKPKIKEDISKRKAILLEEMKNDHVDTIRKHRTITNFNIKGLKKCV